MPFFWPHWAPRLIEKKILWANTLVFGGGLILFSHTTWFPLAMLFAMVSGFGMMAQTTITNTIIQTSVAPAMRGRVISYFAMAYFGMQPLGSLLVGAVSQYTGAPYTMLIEGLAAIGMVILFWSWLRKKEIPLRPTEQTSTGHAVKDKAIPSNHFNKEKWTVKVKN